MTGKAYRGSDNREALSQEIERQLSEAARLNDLRSQLGRFPQSPRILQLQEDINRWFTDTSSKKASLDNLNGVSESAPESMTQDEFTARLIHALQTDDPTRQKALRLVLKQLLDQG